MNTNKARINPETIITRQVNELTLETEVVAHFQPISFTR